MSAAPHADRAHSVWSASSTARNWNCAGALALSGAAPDGKESIHAARGTACHEVAERCLRQSRPASDFVGDVIQTKEHKVEIDEEIADSAQMYVDYVLSRVDCEAGIRAHLQIEQRFSLADLDPPFDAGGTGDAVIHNVDEKKLEIVDLKNGMGVVDAKENPQLRTYALGAMLANPNIAVETIIVTIVQPRAPHKDGRIRSETFHVADLVEWTADLLAAMHRSKAAKDAHDTLGGNSVLFDAWADAWLTPGKCTFCPAEGFCPAVKKKALAVAEAWFDDTDQLRVNSMQDASPEAVARDLAGIPLLESWIKARAVFAKSLAERGIDIPGWQLSEKIGNRKWGDEDAATRLLTDAGVDPFAKKLVSPAQAEKLLGAKRKALIEPFVKREVTGTELVSASKTSRPPAASRADKYFVET